MSPSLTAPATIAATALLAAGGGAQPAAAPTPVGAMVVWNSGQNGASKTFSSGGVTVTLSVHHGAQGEMAPTIRAEAGGQALSLVGDPSELPAAANAGVGRLDASAEGLQVLFSDYTGGAHCCDHVRVLERLRGAWRVVDVAKVEGGPLEAFPADLDGDGVADIVLPDDRFAYAFTYYAASHMPPRIYNLANGVVVDVSASPKYAQVFRQDMARAAEGCRQHGNGACAAYVADAARVGEFARAWRVMLASYDKTARWDWPRECLVHAPPGRCPKSKQRTFPNMPDALKAFLIRLGYIRAG